MIQRSLSTWGHLTFKFHLFESSCTSVHFWLILRFVRFLAVFRDFTADHVWIWRALKKNYFLYFCPFLLNLNSIQVLTCGTPRNQFTFVWMVWWMRFPQFWILDKKGSKNADPDPWNPAPDQNLIVKPKSRTWIRLEFYKAMSKQIPGLCYRDHLG